MPSPLTVLQICRDGLGLTNAVGTDQVLTADESDLCLRVFNNVQEDYSTQNMAVYGSANDTFNTVVGQSVYTIGTGGNFNTDRPVRINEPAYVVANGSSFPVLSMTQAEYNMITVKTQTQEWPYRYLYVNDFPLGLITLWPVPSSVVPITFSIDRVLTQATTISQTVSFPPGYCDSFIYSVGVKLAPYFGKNVARDYPDVVAEQRRLFANLKRANKQLTIMSYPGDLANANPNYPSFIAGYYT